MKKYIFSMLLAVAMVFAACSDDRDGNPTIQQPNTFKLNAPSGDDVDLSTVSSIKLEYEQPSYGFNASTTYYVQMSTTDKWEKESSEGADDATFIELEGSVNSEEVEADAAVVNKNIMKLGGYKSADQIPSGGVSLYFRVRAILGSGYECISNSVKLTVKPYFVVLVAADPELWYMIGGSIGDGSWGTDIGKGVVPMSPVAGAKYDDVTGQGEFVYIGYFLADGGFKIVKTPGQWDEQWGAEENNDITKPYKKDANKEGHDFKVPVDGYYKVTLDTKNNKLSIVAVDAPAHTYSHLFISGGFNGWGSNDMTPVNSVSGAENHVWTYELDAAGDTTAKFLYDGWAPNWGNSDFPFGFGTNGGANIPVAAGKYIVIFNDIDGYYHFFSK